MSGNYDSIIVLSLLPDANILALELKQTSLTVPIWPPNFCTIFLVVVSHIYTHLHYSLFYLSVEPVATYKPSNDQPPFSKAF